MLWAKPPIPLGETTHLYDLNGPVSGAMSLPTDIAIGTGDRAYVVDSGQHRVVAFGPDGKYLFSIGNKGSNPGEFLWPVGIATDKQGQVYVADKDNRRIQVFDGDGQFQRSFPVKNREGGEGRPVDLAISPSSGLIFVTETDSHQMLVFDADGTPLGSWGGKGVKENQFRYPATLAIKAEHIYVVDVLNTLVKLFSERGEFEHGVGEWGVAPGQFYRPKGVAVDDWGRIYVSDSYLQVVQVFNAQFKFSYVLATEGDQHPFTTPVGMAIDSKHRLYVAEMLSNKVSVFQLAAPF